MPGPSYDTSRLLFDPYARGIQLGSPSTDPSAPVAPLSVVVADRFDWGVDRRPATSWEVTVLYEVHVGSSAVLACDVPPEIRGTYGGCAHPAFQAHLVDLGVTAVVLLSVQAFLPPTGTIGYFSRDTGYAASREPEQQVREFKELVRACHRINLEVILDVTFDQTVEHGPGRPHREFPGVRRAVLPRAGHTGGPLAAGGPDGARQPPLLGRRDARGRLPHPPAMTLLLRPDGRPWRSGRADPSS
ncbi:MAG TPA: hypothetical protein VK975_05840 [Acidimicrobiales bacterium]|nr:hypothetical protein [Acidimicrobiales bacterium]